MPNFPKLLWYLYNSLNRLHWDGQRLEKFQTKRFKSVVKHAYDSVPFYHERFTQAGISPNDIKSLSDLSKLPLIKKEELRREDPRRLISSNYELSRLKVRRTSGSSGKPFQIYIDSSEDAWRKAIYMRANISCGQKMKDRWVALTAPHHFSDTTKIQRKLGIFAEKCISVFESVDEQVRQVEDARPNVLDGYSSSLLLLAKEVEQRKIETITPRIIFGTAELIDSLSMKYVENTFNAPFYDQFGCSEVDRTAWQCPEKVGYHMDIDSVITQFVDEDGNELSKGEKGEVVYTSLFNYAMPLIRYAVGDVGVPSDEECPCGRSLPLMKVVEGRKDSLLHLPGGRLLSPRAITNAVAEFIDKIVQYRVVQKKIDLLNIYIQKKNDVDERELQTELVRHLNGLLSLNKQYVSINVEFVKEMPKSKTGKLMAVSSEV
jgi:phenylacetate-CoA ligase